MSRRLHRRPTSVEEVDAVRWRPRDLIPLSWMQREALRQQSCCCKTLVAVRLWLSIISDCSNSESARVCLVVRCFNFCLIDFDESCSRRYAFPADPWLPKLFPYLSLSLSTFCFLSTSSAAGRREEAALQPCASPEMQVAIEGESQAD